jgi:suppressor of fused protein SUFU
MSDGGPVNVAVRRLDNHMDPTERMIRLYHHLADQLGDAEDMIEYDETMARNPSHLRLVHIAIWEAKSENDHTVFHTLGMSERYMANADYLVELCWRIRGNLSKEDKGRCSHFLANLTEYPFMYDLKLDLWEHLVDPGKIPMFSECKTLLLGPTLSEQSLSSFPPPDADVKVLHLYPLTELETHVVSEHGREEFVEYVKNEGIDLFSDRIGQDGA